MKKKIFAIVGGCVFALCLIFSIQSNAQEEQFDGPKKCFDGPRCTTGTYNFCDDLGTGSQCSCYYCR